MRAVLAIAAILALALPALAGLTLNGYASGDTTCSNPVLTGSLDNNNCVSTTIHSVQVSAKGSLNGDGTVSGTLYADLTCTDNGAGSFATFPNVVLGACNGPITLTESGNTIIFYTKVTNGAGGVVVSSALVLGVGALVLYLVK